MNRTQPSVVVFSLVITALLLIAVNAIARVVTNVDIPISGTVVNPCNAENVAFNGIDHFSATVTSDGAGGVHVTFHDNIHVTATGDQGNSYEGNQEDVDAFNARVGVEQTFVITFSEISNGSAPNFVVHEDMHITVNPNGTMTVFVDHFTANCRG